MRLGNVCPTRGFSILVLALAASAAPLLAQQPTEQKPKQQKLLGTPVPGQAMPQQPVQQKRTEEKQHVVKKGDTLWDLAAFYLSDPFRWPAIFDANRNVVSNPHWIYPAEKLVIPGTKGPDYLLGAAVPEPAPEPSTPDRSRFFKADVVDTTHLVTSERLRVGPVQPMEWLAAPWIADTASIKVVAKVYKPYDPRDQKDRLSQQFHPYDKLYISLAGPGLKAGDRLLAFREVDDVKGYGVMIEPMAVLRIDSVAENTAVATVSSQFRDLKTGDLAMMLPSIPQLPGERMVEVSGGPVGQIVEFLEEQVLYGTTDYGFVNLGGAQGLTIGDELLAYIPEHKPSSKHAEVLPAEPVARMRVIRVMDKTATVRVTRLTNASLKRGLPVRVARKAP